LNDKKKGGKAPQAFAPQEVEAQGVRMDEDAEAKQEMRAEIGVFGGSGFYSFLEDVQETEADTPYGKPSHTLAIAEVAGRKVAFMPRHGNKHTLPPHMINYRANMWAMKELGVSRIIAPCAAGSLQPDVKPGDFVICDQFVDRTSGRKDTFYDGPKTVHVSTADPYCPEMRSLAIDVAKKQGVRVHPEGTMVVVQGPRFSTRAESRWFSSMGWRVINMTAYPEAALARELEMCYANISLITDYDVGLEDVPGVKPVSHEEVVRVFNSNNERIRKLILELISRLPKERKCPCATALKDATL